LHHQVAVTADKIPPCCVDEHSGNLIHFYDVQYIHSACKPERSGSSLAPALEMSVARNSTYITDGMKRRTANAESKQGR
jgi:hypothetical protein